MLTVRKCSVIITLAAFVIFSGCKKSNDTGDNSGNNTNFVSKYTNPITTVVACDYDVSDTVLTNHGWAKAFDEEFTGDLSNWGTVQGGLSQELQCYEPGNVQIVNGALQITAKHESVTGPKTVGNDTTTSFNYTSGWLISKASFVANSATPKLRIVARIKVASGYGLSSLFWSYGHGAWPTQGEIDFLETQGDNTSVYATDYSYGPTPNKNVVSGGILYNPTTEDLSACYHVYTMEWTQHALISYLDGKLVETKTKGGAIADLFGKNQYLSLSLPVGGVYYSKLNTANIHGGTLYVDYVKVFTSN